MPRLLPRALWAASHCRVRARIEGLRICEPRTAVRSAFYRRSHSSERRQACTLLLGVYAMGTALRKRSAEHDHGLLGRAVGAGPGGAEEGTWCLGPSSAKVEKATPGGQGSCCAKGRSRVEQSDRLMYYVRVLNRYSPSRHCLFSYWLAHPVNTVSGGSACIIRSHRTEDRQGVPAVVHIFRSCDCCSISTAYGSRCWDHGVNHAKLVCIVPIFG